jgi:hypothetical protein
MRIWAHPAQATDRAIRSNSSVRLRRTCGISASIPCASLRDQDKRIEIPNFRLMMYTEIREREYGEKER